MKMVVIVEGIAVCFPNKANAKPPANPAFLDVPRRTILIMVFVLILRSLPTLSITYPSTKIVTIVITAAGIKDKGWLKNTSRFNPTIVYTITKKLQFTRDPFTLAIREATPI